MLDAAFVIAKPPSHHCVGNAQRLRGATKQAFELHQQTTCPRATPFGFCHLNSISAAAAAVIDNGPPGTKVAILDVDVHPGNGNEDTWFADADVLTINLSEESIWPG